MEARLIVFILLSASEIRLKATRQGFLSHSPKGKCDSLFSAKATLRLEGFFLLVLSKCDRFVDYIDCIAFLAELALKLI